MAYMNQEKKAKIHTKLKEIMPKSWKWSLSVRNGSMIALTISKAPIDLLAVIGANGKYDYERLNTYHLKSSIKDEKMLELFNTMTDALNMGNFERSDIQADYFDVGHYISISIGQWNKPFQLA